eukprot:753525-Hanusia_phi.AAC.1
MGSITATGIPSPLVSSLLPPCCLDRISLLVTSLPPRFSLLHFLCSCSCSCSSASPSSTTASLSSHLHLSLPMSRRHFELNVVNVQEVVLCDLSDTADALRQTDLLCLRAQGQVSNGVEEEAGRQGRRSRGHIGARWRGWGWEPRHELWKGRKEEGRKEEEGFRVS